MTHVQKIIAEISEIMSDGYSFCQVRFLLEDLELQGDVNSLKVLQIVDQFYRLCKYATNVQETL